MRERNVEGNGTALLPSRRENESPRRRPYLLHAKTQARCEPAKADVQPTNCPALEPLAEAMGKLVLAEGGEAIRRKAEVGKEVHRDLGTRDRLRP